MKNLLSSALRWSQARVTASAQHNKRLLNAHSSLQSCCEMGGEGGGWPWCDCCLPPHVVRNLFKMVQAASVAALGTGQIAFLPSLTQSRKVFTSVAQEVTEAPFWRQHGMGKGHGLGPNSSSAIYQLGDCWSPGAPVYLFVKCGWWEPTSWGDDQL